MTSGATENSGGVGSYQARIHMELLAIDKPCLDTLKNRLNEELFEYVLSPTRTPNPSSEWLVFK